MKILAFIITGLSVYGGVSNLFDMFIYGTTVDLFSLYYVIWFIIALLFGAITNHVAKTKGYDNGFFWGYWLGVIGLLVVGFRGDNRAVEEKPNPVAKPAEKAFSPTVNASNVKNVSSGNESSFLYSGPYYGSSSTTSKPQSSYQHSDPYYGSSLAQAKIERLGKESEAYKFGYKADSYYQAKIEALEREVAEHRSNLSINERVLCRELAKLREQYALLENKYNALVVSYNKVIRYSGDDSELEMEIDWLKRENARLQTSLSTSERAVYVLNQQIEDLRHKESSG